MKFSAATKQAATEPAADAARDLLADDLDLAIKAFEDAVGQCPFSWEFGGFGAIENGKVFGSCLKDFIEAIQKIIAASFPKLAVLSGRQRKVSSAEGIQRATEIMQSALAGHCNPRKLFRRVFPTPNGRAILLPPGLTPPKYEREAEKHLCAKINQAIESEVRRAGKRALVHEALNPALIPGWARAGVADSHRKRRRRRSLSAQDQSRRETIRDLALMGLKGRKYCQAMDERKVPIPVSWVRDDCPKTYCAAYDNGEQWRKRIQDEKFRHSKHSPTRAHE